MQNFHRAGWLHKSLRSENILFFPPDTDTTIEALLLDPVLVGFAFARLDSPTEISEQPSDDPQCDIYRHPDALGEPSSSFSAIMDVYSLGTMLLEIAKWRSLQYLVKEHVDASAKSVSLQKLAGVQEFFLSGRGRHRTKNLKNKTGDIYTSACLMCLSGKMEHTEDQDQDIMAVKSSLLDLVV